MNEAQLSWVIRPVFPDLEVIIIILVALQVYKNFEYSLL